MLFQEELSEGLYSGQALNGVPHGRGRVIYYDADPSGRANYTGDFEHGILHGNGTMYWRNGARCTVCLLGTSSEIIVMYRVAHLVAEHCLLTPNSKFRHSINFFY